MLIGVNTNVLSVIVKMKNIFILTFVRYKEYSNFKNQRTWRKTHNIIISIIITFTNINMTYMISLRKYKS